MSPVHFSVLSLVEPAGVTEFTNTQEIKTTLSREILKFSCTLVGLFDLACSCCAPLCGEAVSIWAPFYQAEKIRARINSSFAYEDR